MKGRRPRASSCFFFFLLLLVVVVVVVFSCFCFLLPASCFLLLLRLLPLFYIF
jgi:hypothetical protein